MKNKPVKKSLRKTEKADEFVTLQNFELMHQLGNLFFIKLINNYSSRIEPSLVLLYGLIYCMYTPDMYRPCSADVEVFIPADLSELVDIQFRVVLDRVTGGKAGHGVILVIYAIFSNCWSHYVETIFSK